MNTARKYDLVIWDWNGTLLDDTEMCYQIANEMRQERGMQLMRGVEEYRTYFTFPVIDYYRRMGYTFETSRLRNFRGSLSRCMRSGSPSARCNLRRGYAFRGAQDRRAAGAALRYGTGKYGRAGCAL
jgi:hypothetical protein